MVCLAHGHFPGLLTFVRACYGQESSPVTAAEVKAIRTTTENRQAP